MAKAAKGKKNKKGLFETIRKPTAPPSQKLGSEKRTGKLDPINRKAKHKKQISDDPDVQ